jgi:hypothetical protein
MSFELPQGLNKLSYDLYTLEGKRVHSETLEQSYSKGNKLVIDVSELPAGIYQCTLTSGTITANRKMVVSH